MNEDINNYINGFCEDIQELFNVLRKLIIQSVPCKIEEKMWAKLPSYYVGDKFIRIIPFKDHVNIEADAVMDHNSQLEQFKITPKGMLQLYINQSIPTHVLQTIFYETLMK